MMRRTGVTALITICACALILATLGRRLQTARRGAIQSQVRLAQVAQDLDQLRVLGSERELAHGREPPSDDLLTQVRQILEKSSIPGSFRRVSRKSDSSLGDRAREGRAIPSYRRRDETLFLQSISLNELGVFLSAWHEARPLWQVTAIDLTRPSNAPPSIIDYDARLQLTTVYVATTIGDSQ